MYLQCPECNARYLVPDSAIPAQGRTVRCAKCSHTWFKLGNPEKSADISSELDKMLDEINTKPRPIPAGSNLPARIGERASIVLKAGVFITTIAACLLATVIYIPGLVRLPRSEGIMLSDVAITKDNEAKNTAYQITGRIVNSTHDIKRIPTLRVTLVDDDGSSLQFWDFGGDISELEANHAVPFNTGDLEIRFTKGTRFVVELGNPLELALRRKPPVVAKIEKAPDAAPEKAPEEKAKTEEKSPS